jgi:hypothetical protein
MYFLKSFAYFIFRKRFRFYHRPTVPQWGGAHFAQGHTGYPSNVFTRTLLPPSSASKSNQKRIKKIKMINKFSEN